jgi:hypothetical protein
VHEPSYLELHAARLIRRYRAPELDGRTRWIKSAFGGVADIDQRWASIASNAIDARQTFTFARLGYFLLEKSEAGLSEWL